MQATFHTTEYFSENLGKRFLAYNMEFSSFLRPPKRNSAYLSHNCMSYFAKYGFPGQRSRTHSHMPARILNFTRNSSGDSGMEPFFAAASLAFSR